MTGLAELVRQALRDRDLAWPCATRGEQYGCPCHSNGSTGGFELFVDDRGRPRCAAECPADRVLAALGLGHVAEEPSSNGNGPHGAEPDGWPPLKPLDVRELPEFPTDALPAALRAWVEATAEATQTPRALAAGMVLATVSAAALGAARVECQPGWEEELAIYTVVILPSGERKSTVVRSAVAPLRALERELAEAARPRVAEALAEREGLEERRKQLVREVGKGKGDPDELADVAQRLAALPEPVEPRLLADDATPEALAGLLARHGQLAVLAAESALLDNLAGRYAEGKANLHLVCQAYDGEEAHIDRRGRAPEYLPRPLLALGLAVQPHVFAVLASHPVMREQGFLPRIAVLTPASKVGCREMRPPSVPPAVTAGYEKAIRQVAGSVGSVSDSPGLLLGLSRGADAALTEHRREIEPRLEPARGDLAPMGAWASKHPGRVARIAGLLHLLTEDPQEPIAAVTMDAALRIGDYLLDHARGALLEHEAERRPLARAGRWAAERPDGEFSLRDVQRGPLNGHGTAEQAQRLVELLEERGHVRPLPPPRERQREGSRRARATRSTRPPGGRRGDERAEPRAVRGVRRPTPAREAQGAVLLPALPRPGVGRGWRRARLRGGCLRGAAALPLRAPGLRVRRRPRRDTRRALREAAVIDPLAAILDCSDPATLDRLAELLAPRLEGRLGREQGPDGWLDSQAAAAYLGVSRHAVHRLTAERRVPFAQDGPGARCYFRREDLDEWRRTGSRGCR